MLTEVTGNNIFGRLKSVFSSSEPTENNTTSETDTETAKGYNTVKAFEEQATPELPHTVSVLEKEITVRTVEVTAPQITMPDEKDLDIRFATSFIKAGGKFIFCETIREAIQQLEGLKEDMNWSHVFCWENEVRDAFMNYGFQKGSIGFTIENSDAAISLCETLIAEDGTILLNPKQASRRRLPVFPKTHIIFTDVAHLAAREVDALEQFKKTHKGELPSLIKIGSCNNGHFYDKQRLILNAEGTENVYVFLIDEIIPHSLRP